ncbi:hypothetical protein yc1106_09248 [Curvularia clavata]|uniref:PHD-type domain-containing protein n=1 Tax=Curvularia clavata TaxID=95742 RepID=A0A9Q8ZG11_CURCL|nr:hypothetical protein yc1106_09248 [Curvularia clavata]
MSTQVASPPPSSPARESVAASPPLPELPRYYHASRTYKPKPICICDTPHDKTYSKPFIICRTRASKCPVKYYHAACVGEVPRDLHDKTLWFCAHCMSDDVVPTRVCICGDQLELSTPIVQCSRKAACGVRWYHRACVGSLEDEGKWLCQLCVTEDREDEDEDEDEAEKQQRQQPQAQSQKLPQQKQQKQQQPEEDEDSEPPARRIGQKRQKRQHHAEREDEEHAAPARKRVRFAPEPVSEEQTALNESHESSQESSPEEPEYCFCGQPSSNEMVACDGKKCDREWFHFECVGMTRRTVPKGKWYCDECSTEMKKTKTKGRKGKAGRKKRKR